MTTTTDPVRIFIGRKIPTTLKQITNTTSEAPVTREQITVKRNGDIRLGKQGGIVFEPSSKKLWYPDEFKNFVTPHSTSSHLLSKLILRPLNDFITAQEIIGDDRNEGEVLKNVNFELFRFESGSIPASANDKSTYSKFCWTRDTAIGIDSMIELGCIDDAIKGVYCLAELYNRRENRSILTSYHWHPGGYQTAVDRYKTGDGGHVHIRAEIDSNGNLIRSNQGWAHNQLDALGAWLYVTFRLANVLNDKINHPDIYDPNFLRNLNKYLSEHNDENNLDSIFSVAFKSLNRIHCWDNYDVGVWEDVYARKRTSSIASILRAAHETRWYFHQNKWDTMPIHDTDSFRREIDEIIENCTRSINERVPLDGSCAIETDVFPSDVALSFLLYPYKVELNQAQENAILRSLYENRMSVAGFTRRDNDTYMGMGYQYNPEGEGINAYPYVPDYQPAEWTLFDPNLSIYFADKTINQLYQTRTIDEAALELSEFHFRRAISQITPHDDSFLKRYHSREKGAFVQEEIHTRKGRLPESYSYDPYYKDPVTGTHGKRRAVDHCPLFWTEANFMKMLKKQIQLKTLLEKIDPFISRIAA